MARPAVAIRTPLKESAPKISLTVSLRPQIACPVCMSSSPFESLEEFYAYGLHECSAYLRLHSLKPETK
jgi:hypothetical protein